ncbi:hypothetical protein RND71_040727 [Anisodus tanguticus]|uniref:PAS domain-containing protein n=1 Tax=Anisodus tanguticus TaxID=243964 RepID=A0AAE1UW01_9SOLA|nr:hypothetical protein RND71_040727 [Anisodus tanguticus]
MAPKEVILIQMTKVLDLNMPKNTVSDNPTSKISRKWEGENGGQLFVWESEIDFWDPQCDVSFNELQKPTCTSASAINMESQRGISIEQSFDCYSAGFQESLDQLPDSFTITDPYVSGNPIVYASRGFLEMFGYSKYEVIGRSGRIFQGPKTNRRSVLEVREAIREERDIQISLLSYRKDRTPFWMLFHMCPVFD